MNRTHTLGMVGAFRGALLEHRPSDLQVGGVTCVCGYWTGSESGPNPIRAGETPLSRHIATELALVSLGLRVGM